MPPDVHADPPAKPAAQRDGPTPRPKARQSLVAGYHAFDGLHDHATGLDGNVTETCQPLWDRLAHISRDELNRRRAQAQRRLDDNGILLTGPHGSSQQADHPHLWTLDPVPFLMRAADFEPLTQAITQRATLLNRIAADMLGEQHALRDKVLPPALLFANPHFHRSYLDLPVGDDRYVHLYAADVIATEPGRWWAVSDRTQAPSGLGFTLENRIALARAHNDWYAAMNVHRHAGFFITLRETLAGLSPGGRENPHVVLLSEGPQGHRGFEDAFLARYLGYTLVVGEDLATRQGHTVLKTLGGAVPVDVIFRRVSDAACDPVELDTASNLGVAGLLESHRLEHVSIANMLGTQLVEAPALRPFLPALCRYYFQEDLKLPSIATWWCGQRDEREHVLANLDRFYICPAFQTTLSPIDAATLSQTKREQLVDRIRNKPEMFIAQERPQRCTTPSWDGHRLAPRHWGMRCFAVMSGAGYHVMQGGLVRTADTNAELDTEPGQGERAQDCWVRTDRRIEAVSLLPASESPIVLKRSGAELPSRVADNLYWLGRSIEATEALARLLRCLLARADAEPQAAPSTSGPAPDQPAQPTPLQPLIALIAPGYNPASHHTSANPLVDAVFHATLGPPEPGNLRHSVRECVRLAQAVRDRIAIDAWRLMTSIEREVLRAAAHDRSPRKPDAPADLADLLNRLVLDLVAMGGLMSDSMTRTLGWRFMDMGRRVERATHTLRRLAASMIEPADDERPVLDALLEVCDSNMTYRARYLADLRPVPVLDLLLTDEINPRSVAFQLMHIDDHVNALPRGQVAASAAAPAPALRDADQRVSLELLTAVRLADPYALTYLQVGKRRESLDQLVARLRDRLPEIEHEITARYLVHTTAARQFVAVNPPGLPHDLDLS